MMYKTEDFKNLNKYLLPVFLGMIVFLNDQVINILLSGNDEESMIYVNAIKGFNSFTGILIVFVSLIVLTMFPKPKWLLYLLSNKKSKNIIKQEKQHNNYSELLKLDERINYVISLIVYYAISLVFIIILIASFFLLLS